MTGLSSIREVAALFSPYGQHSNAGKLPDCLLCEVTQPSDTRLSETTARYDNNT